MRRVGVLIATAGGAGYFPVAPGTIGSAVGVAVYIAIRRWPLTWQVGVIVAIAAIGTWAGSVAAAHFAKKDPGQVVIDEVAGQLVTLAGVSTGPVGIAAGFLIFRALDVVKPWPANRFERLPGGIGIMADDLMAGVYGNVLLRLLALMLPVR